MVKRSFETYLLIMARQYLAEGIKGSFPFVADTSKIVVESLPNGKTRTRIPGRFSVCDSVNGNNRRYGKRVWEKNFESGSVLMTSIQENAAFGLLEHPKDGQVSLQSPICIQTSAAKLQEGKDKEGKPIWEVVGEIAVVGTQEGEKLRVLIDAGYNPRVSSRGFGSLVRNVQDGVDDVQDDYICEGWDVVLKPSFESAVLQPERETATANESKLPAVPAKLSETLPATAAAPAPASVPAPAPSAPAAQLPPQSAPVQESSKTNKSMNANEIQSQIASFRSTDPAKLTPKRFAEGMAQLTLLHNEIAKFLAEDATRSWSASQLHEEIKAIENAWSATQLAPGKRATKLTEDNTKLMQVIKAVAQTGLALKKKIGESSQAANRQAALLNEVTERGQAWRQRSKALESECAKFNRRFMMASEALHQFAAKYRADITEMGKAHLSLEFKDKLTPDIQKMLKEAAKPKALVPIRLALEGKITLDVAKSILEGKVSLAETLKGIKSESTALPKTPVQEGQSAAAPPAAEKQPAASAPAAANGTPVSEGVKIISSQPSDPRQLNEAVGMVTRLSKASVS